MAPADQCESLGSNGRISDSDRKKTKSKKRAKRKPEMDPILRHPVTRSSFLDGDRGQASTDAKSKKEEELEILNEIAAGKSSNGILLVAVDLGVARQIVE